MTDESQGTRAAGPPWSVDVLADLHAGVLTEHEAAELWPRAQADPEARAILEALEATTADLASLAAVPPQPIPADVAARLDAAMAAEVQRAGLGTPAAQAAGQGQVGQVVDLAAARRRRNQRIGWISGVVAVAAAAIAAVAIAIPNSDTGGAPVAAPPSPTSEAPGGTGSGLALRSDQPQAAIGSLSTGVKDYGPLGDAQGLSACLQAAGLPSTADPIGVRPGTLDGAPAVFALLTTGKLAEFRLVAVSPECGAQPLLDKVVGK